MLCIEIYIQYQTAMILWNNWYWHAEIWVLIRFFCWTPISFPDILGTASNQKWKYFHQAVSAKQNWFQRPLCAKMLAYSCWALKNDIWYAKNLMQLKYIIICMLHNIVYWFKYTFFSQLMYPAQKTRVNGKKNLLSKIKYGQVFYSVCKNNYLFSFPTFDIYFNIILNVIISLFFFREANTIDI